MTEKEEPIIHTHPAHIHPLIKRDTRQLYKEFESRWKCDVCHRSYDGRSDEESHRYAYHCTQCTTPDYFDICDECFKGYTHSFHTHRLKPARSNICYPRTKGVWRCDACKRVFGIVTNQTNYHCGKCSVDLCTDCFKGKWRHVLHGNGSHTLYPIDPRIEYRHYKSWSCDVCNKTGEHGERAWLLYHCKLCEEDVCETCFEGTAHHQHQHGIVERERGEERRWEAINCSICSLQITSQHYYSCRFPNCPFFMCRECFRAPPRPHPLHPAHPLNLTDPLKAYPDVGGTWHCDNCGKNANAPSKMYHCGECEFDLCEKCFKGDTPKATPPTPPWPHPPSSAPPLSQQHMFFASKEQYRRPLVRPPTNFIPSPPTSIPAPTLCRVCGLATARLTPTHNGRGHSEPLYCQECARSVLASRETCYRCGLVPDGMALM